MYCKNCGHVLNDGEKFCTNCGTQNNMIDDNINNKFSTNNVSNKNHTAKRSNGFWLGLFIGEFVLFIMLMLSVNSTSNINTDGTDVNNFIYTLENRGYLVQKSTSYNNSYIIDYYIATKDGYQLDFINTSDSNSANSLFYQFKNQIDSSKGSVSSVENISVNDYKRYAVTSNATSYIVAKSGNTVLYANALSNYKEELNQIFSELGYGEVNILGIVFYLIIIFMIILVIVIYWKIFEKAGMKGWYSLIPIYNLYCMTKVAFGKGIYLLLMFVPVVNFIFFVMMCYKLAKAFGKSSGFAICSIFFSWITLQIIAFDDSKYVLNK